MPLPINLIFVRHGESEMNLAHDKARAGEIPDGDENSREKTQDAEILLTRRGENQAKIAGNWLRENAPKNFARYYCSPFYRTRETAALLKLHGNWRLDDRLREQDWAEFSVVQTDENRAKFYPFSFERFSKNFWYWVPPNGESKSSNVRARIDSFFATLAREVPDENVIAVSHGGAMSVAEFILEKLNFDELREELLPNCGILWYSRQNPETGEISAQICFRKMVCPWDENLSWNGGNWTKLNLSEKVLSDEKLLASIKNLGKVD